MAPDPPAAARAQLRQWLVRLLISVEMEEPSDDAVALEKLLNEAVDGLDALDGGEIPPIFEPAETNAKFTKPVTLQGLQLAALGHIAVLTAMGYPAIYGRRMIAAAFGYPLGESAEGTVRKWRERLLKANPGELNAAEKTAIAVYRTHQNLSWPYTLESVLRSIKRDGDKFQLIKDKKTQGKNPT
jgi:hypothetical protein